MAAPTPEEKISSMRMSVGGLARLRKYGMKGDSDEQIVTRILNELSAYRIKDGLPATGVLEKNITKATPPPGSSK
jgi:hypothetical protein